MAFSSSPHARSAVWPPPPTGCTGPGVPGTVRPIVQVGDPVLSTRCAEVTEFDDALVQLLADMFASMYAADGVGLAANQIGVGVRVFVYDCPDDEQVFHRGVVINPTLVPPAERHLEEDDEGCLSVRHQFHAVARPDAAPVTALGVHLVDDDPTAGVRPVVVSGAAGGDGGGEEDEGGEGGGDTDRFHDISA